MNARHRWIICLLLYHLIQVTFFLQWDRGVPTTHWLGSLLAFALPTVQYTWSYTVGLILGPSRRYRRWFWTTLLLIFIPLSFARILCWLAYHFLGLPVAMVCGVVLLVVLLAETYSGILYGVQAHCRHQER